MAGRSVTAAAQPRQPAGAPAGGQYAGVERPESDLDLGLVTGPGIWAVTAPGIVDGMPEDVYHGDPVVGGSVSQSGAKELLACPAKFRWNSEHPKTSSKAFDLGKVAHSVALGTGADYVVLDFKDWRTKAAQEAKTAAEDAGKTPVLAHDHARVQDMVAALRRDPVAGKLLDPEHGKAEQSMFFRDPASGLWVRGRADWINEPEPSGIQYIDDYKTADSAHPEKISKAVADYGYHIQAATYSWIYSELTGNPDVRFRFIVQEKTPPYVVTVVDRLENQDLNLGFEQMQRALEILAECRRTGVWPGYVTKPTKVGLPEYYRRRVARDGV